LLLVLRPESVPRVATQQLSFQEVQIQKRSEKRVADLETELQHARSKTRAADRAASEARAAKFTMEQTLRLAQENAAAAIARAEMQSRMLASTDKTHAELQRTQAELESTRREAADTAVKELLALQQLQRTQAELESTRRKAADSALKPAGRAASPAGKKLAPVLMKATPAGKKVAGPMRSPAAQQPSRMATTSRGQSQPRRLTVTIHACRNLANKEGFRGKNDVYCRLNIEDESKRTTTIDDGGSKPVWVGGEKHSFDRPEGLQTLEVEVLDHDDIGSDDLIGKQSVDLSRYGFEEADEDWSIGEPVWLGLAGKKGNKTAGEIQLSYAWADSHTDSYMYADADFDAYTDNDTDTSTDSDSDTEEGVPPSA
jgi:hypothetical protein